MPIKKDQPFFIKLIQGLFRLLKKSKEIFSNELGPNWKFGLEKKNVAFPINFFEYFETRYHTFAISARCPKIALD